VREHWQISTTTETKDDAARIAAALVERRLAACVQVLGPITSTFRWEGQFQSAEEWLCTAKTRRDLYPQVEAVIRELHTYEVPEIIATPVVAGSKSYLDWVDAEVLPPAGEQD
jgi:periplasmic divalent cation tolerance protein